MPIITVQGIPDGAGRLWLGTHVRKTLQAAAAKIKELGLKQEDFIIKFPTDRTDEHEGEGKIIVTVDGLFIKPERTKKVRKRLAKALGKAVAKIYPYALVICIVHPFNPDDGFWTSVK